MSKWSKWRSKISRRDVIFGSAVATAAGTAGYLSADQVSLVTLLLSFLAP